MNAKVLKTLEYEKIINVLVQKATSDPGRRMCSNLLPDTDIEKIREAQAETRDALSRIFKSGQPNFGGNKDIRGDLKSLQIGSVLSSRRLLDIAGQLECAARAKKYNKSNRDEDITDVLSSYFDELYADAQVASEIRRCILAEDEYADDASTNLKRIRRAIQNAQEKIHSQLTSMLNGSLRTYLQEAVITLRGDRYCVPVKSEYKSQVPGMIHDQSSTGSTVFIEPAAIVDINNQIKQLCIEEEEEIQVILATLSEMVTPYIPYLFTNFKIMRQLDFIFAKGAYALEVNGTEPIFNDQHYIDIRGGRHPLLDKKKTVPIDINLGKNFELLIVTGPNTGGKTVSLKTIGLFTLMGQAGLHIPAKDRSELSVFREVYADIGDEQSIEQSLSTFSSHMTSIVNILKKSNKDSLCLFDELCAGTDPVEGAALAIAILENLHKRGIRTMTTTHYSELKIYALQTAGVENACCEFDVETLSPTYRLLIGIPGKSNAFAISSKLGLADGIIDNARKHLDSNQESFEDVLGDLEKSRREMEASQREIAENEAKIARLKEELEKSQQKLENQRQEIIRKANEEARDILKEAKDTADETIRIFRKAGPGASMKDLEKARSQVGEKLSDKSRKSGIVEVAKATGGLRPDQIKKGDAVTVLSMNLKGIVASLPDKKGNLFVQCGIIKSQVNISDLALRQEEEIKAPGYTRSSTGKMKAAKSATISTEINLLGKTVDEALPELDKYLDDAYLAHLPSVRIVHGKGTGALRTAVQNHLRKNKRIAEYRLGTFGEGDAGVTIATFK